MAEGRRPKRRRKQDEDKDRKRKQHRRPDSVDREAKDDYKERRRHKKDDKKKKKKKKLSKSRRDDSSSSLSDNDESYDKRRRDRHRRHRKDKKHRKTKSKEQKEKDEPLQRNYDLADACVALFDAHSALATDLPVILVRLASGTTFDLTRMQPPSAAQGLQQVFAALKPFGVENDQGNWKWNSPTGAAHNNTNELVLVRVVTALLDQIGITYQAVSTDYKVSNQKQEQSTKQQSTPTAQAQQKLSLRDENHNENVSIKEMVQRLFDSFSNQSDKTTTNTLPTELAGLCQMILDGESVSLDGLPDEKLREALEALLENACGLTKTEMEKGEQDDNDSEEGEDEPSWGYALPDREKNTTTIQYIQEQLTRIQEICQTVAARPARIQGPKRPPTNFQATMSDDDNIEDDDVGPSIVPRSTEPIPDAATLKAQAARRQRELSAIAAGHELPDETDGAREEWMMTPGKSNFMDFLKTGQPLKGRKFQGKSGGGSGDRDDAPVDPQIRAEVDALMQAHADARGPSLMDEHQAAQKRKKEEEMKEAAAGGDGKKSWKWSRNQDLDAGRRVDKNALQMVFGGAATGLKSKFQGGFHGAR